uniref:Uncharacterized protein n=1 Tax=Arundo donax TaxID=35708 RepID=A0A0A9BND6_ARUDO
MHSRRTTRRMWRRRGGQWSSPAWPPQPAAVP